VKRKRKEHGGTCVPLRDYFEALRAADQRALQIKEEGDAKALNLAREIQTYKDEKANELRSQIEQERGTYVTHTQLTSEVEKIEAVVQPLAEYVTGERRYRETSGSQRLLTIAIITVVVIVVNLGIYLFTSI
jgi:vacuolar-type H+-ATPase subunit E/Vma4